MSTKLKTEGLTYDELKEKAGELRSAIAEIEEEANKAETRAAELDQEAAGLEVDVELGYVSESQVTEKRELAAKLRGRAKEIRAVLPTKKAALDVVDNEYKKRRAAEIKAEAGELAVEMSEHLAKAAEINDQLRQLESQAKLESLPFVYGYTMRSLDPRADWTMSRYTNWIDRMRKFGHKVHEYVHP